ncbi:MAG: hypothetical protein U5N86_03320 [Planctomycetota bacterium]|nr:hypothetical protein [Planctomycetota bacterium]
MADATEAAQKKAQKIEDETQHEIKRQKQAALEQIELERDKAVRELKNQIGELSIEVARTVLEREVSEKDHEQLVKSFLEDLEDRSN